VSNPFEGFIAVHCVKWKYVWTPKVQKYKTACSYEINCGCNTVASGRGGVDVLIFESNDELLHSKNGYDWSSD